MNLGFAEKGYKAIHMQENVVNHQLLMLKSLKDERIARQKERDEYDMELGRCDRKVAAIAKTINSLLITCGNRKHPFRVSAPCLTSQGLLPDWWNIIISTCNKVLGIQKNNNVCVWYI